MNQLEDKLGSLPNEMIEVARVVGPIPAVQIARKLGGSRIYLSRKMYSAHPLAQAIGLPAALIVRQALDRDYWVIPNCKTFLNWADARVLRKCGFSASTIADRIGVTPRHVHKLLQGFVPSELAVTPLAVEIAKSYCVKNRLTGAFAVAHPSFDPQPSRPVDRTDGQLDLGFLVAPSGMRLTDA